MSGLNLEELREIFKDDRIHLAIGKVLSLDLASDRSVLRVKCEMWPESIKVIAKVTWDQCGPEAGIYGFPVVNDLVLLAMANGNSDLCFVIRRLTSLEDKIPLHAVDGATVVRSLAGKKVKVVSDTKILHQRTQDADPTENHVLGQVFKVTYSSDLQSTADHRHVCLPPGYKSVEPDNRQDFLDIKASPVDDEVILSDLSFTQK